MFDIQEAPVFQKTFDLLKTFHQTRTKFPKSEKYTLGEQTENSLLAILLKVVEAGRTKKTLKSVPIEHAIIATDKTQILIRLLAALQIITEKEYVRMSTDIQHIARMLGGWKRSM